MFPQHAEGEILTKNGDSRLVNWDNVLLIDSQDNVIGVACIGRDVTDQHRLEAELRHAQKMETVGQLAGGVAHDFNNLLQAITGYSEMAAIEIPVDSPARVSLEQVQRASERAVRLVRQLLLFSRQHRPDPVVLSLNELITEAAGMLQRIIGEHITLVLSVGSDIRPVCADADYIEHALTNLCVNARDAMPDGGVILVETRNVFIGEDFCENNAWATPGEYAMLAVSDDGPGIPTELQGRIFEPFFTTKEIGKGTGLGLATVYGIVQKHNGLLNLISTPGHGARFELYFPAVAATLTAAAAPIGKRREMIMGSETILVAEDEELVRQFTVEILQRAGYRVIVAENGIEALDMAQRYMSEIDLALLDVVMPGASGKQVFDLIRTLPRKIPVLFVSGYRHDLIDTSAYPPGTCAILAKPYRPTELLKTIRERLDDHAGHKAIVDACVEDFSEPVIT